MDRERFMKLSFKGYMTLHYCNARLVLPVECLLLAVDFDNNTVKIIPSADCGFEEKEFWCSIDYIELPPKRLKVVK